MADKPTVDPKWATNQLTTQVLEPAQTFKDSGVAAGSTISRRYFNWMFNAISQWVDWVRSYAMDRTLNLSDLENKATSRANLGANNATNLTTGIIPAARLPDTSLTATGAVTGTVTLPKSGNASIALSASPTLTLSGDASGSATFTDLANATLTVTVNDNSHSHDSSTLASGSTTQKGVLQLSTSTSSTSTTLAATPSAVKSAYDLANGKISATTANVQTATAAMSAGAVGTYAMAQLLVGGAVSFGTVVSGSSLKTANAYGSIEGPETILTGTWRCMGMTATSDASVRRESATTLWLRIS